MCSKIITIVYYQFYRLYFTEYNNLLTLKTQYQNANIENAFYIKIIQSNLTKKNIKLEY
ncbi:hypothetical protein HMPREF1866_01156 [Lachnoanaerobaculum saburreum]|uniref:Uncharacterized protein n=1 Tax=Lachnoanaerobaculum saburreum TaxID=467210 RepID=A0A133ZRZ5_9FIRM|nr:hypothetical protein HMPREF1866_01156 [Lachnoanaerobaculum saburreum]